MNDKIYLDLNEIIDRSTMKRAGALIMTQRRSRRGKLLTIWPCLLAVISTSVAFIAVLSKIDATIPYQITVTLISLAATTMTLFGALYYDGEKTEQIRNTADEFQDVASLAKEVLRSEYASENARLAAAKASDEAYRKASRLPIVLPDEYNPSITLGRRGE